MSRPGEQEEEEEEVATQAWTVPFTLPCPGFDLSCETDVFLLPDIFLFLFLVVIKLLDPFTAAAFK